MVPVLARAAVACGCDALFLEVHPRPDEAKSDGPNILELDRLPQLLREMTETLEKKYLLRALKKTRGNIGRCAWLCGLSRRSISAKLAEYHIDKRQFKGQEM